MQVNIIMTNKDFPKVVFKKKTVVSDSYIKKGISSGWLLLQTRLVPRSTCKTGLFTHSTCLTTRSTRSNHLSARNTRLSTRSTRFSTPSTRFSDRSTHLSTRGTRLTCSNICRSFHNWSVIKRPRDGTTSNASGQTYTTSGLTNPHFNDLSF